MVTPFKKHRSIGIFTSYVKQYMYFQVIYRQNQNRFFLTFFFFSSLNNDVKYMYKSGS